MGNVRVDQRVQHGQDFLNKLQKAAKSGELSGGKLFATRHGEVTTLFVRSRLADVLMKLFMPGRRAMQKQLAQQALSEALSEGYPGMAPADLLPMAGIRANASIRLDLFRNFSANAKAYINAKAREDAQVAINEGKINLQGWRITQTPGLEALARLTSNDLKAWGAHQLPGMGEELAAFRQFACAAAGLHAPPTASDDQVTRKAVEFMSAWTRLPGAEKSALYGQLNAQGRSAFEAIDALVPKAIEALRLPVAGGVRFGLSASVADKPTFRTAFGEVAQALVLPTSREITQSMTFAADRLGNLIGDSMRGSLSASIIAQPTGFRNAVRNFLDHHVNPAFGSTEYKVQNRAIREWLINKDAFLERTCNTALRTWLLSPEIRKADGEVTIAGKAYAIGDVLGEGAEGVVSEARDLSNGNKVVIKTSKASEVSGIPPSSSPREAVMHQMAAATGSPHLLGFHGAARTADGGLRIAMELAPYGSLQDVIDRLAAGQESPAPQTSTSRQQIALARHALHAMATGLRDLHGAGLLHRDMKGGNVFICSDGLLKIGDFGKTVLSSENITVDRPADAPQWLPPEFGRPKGYTEFTPGADLWSMAIVVFELATGMRPPFEREMNSEALEALDHYFKDSAMLIPASRRQALGLVELHRSDPELADLLVDLLHPQPHKRPTAAVVLGRMRPTGDSRQLGQLLIDLSTAQR